MAHTLQSIYKKLFEHWGPQHWWPAETPFEVMVGAVLTQNAAWSNVERAIANLRAAGCLDAQAIVSLGHERLGELIRPSGYFNVKATRLANLCRWYTERGGHEGLAALGTGTLREALLAVSGVGPETADDILLYAFARPVFVIDAYTRRLFGRLGLVDTAAGYEALRGRFESGLGGDVPVYNEYHALIVRHAKHVCRKRPACGACCLSSRCPRAGASSG